MAATIIYKGSDEQIVIRLYEDDNKTIPISIDALDDLQIRIAVGQNVTRQYNKDGSGDFTALERIDAFNYWFYLTTDPPIYLGRADMWIELIDTNNVLPDNFENTIRATFNIFNIQNKPY